MTQPLDHGPAAREVAIVAGAVTDDHLSAPTPCSAYTVSDLLTHLIGLSFAFRDAARKVGGTASPEAAIEHGLDPQWRTTLPQRLDELVEAWKDPAAWSGMTKAGGVDLPGDIAGVVALDEIVLHGWDLARATGQEYNCDPVTTQAIFEFTKQSAAEAADSGDGIFGPVVEVPADAPMFDRALGYAGRDPNWAP